MEELKSELLYEQSVDLEEPLDLGETPHGRRHIYHAKGGSFEGPKLKGDVLPGGGDWFLLRPDGAGELDVRVIFRTDVDYRSGRRASLADIEAGTRAALALARELGASSIAFPLLGAGIVGLPRQQVAAAMLRPLREAGDLEVVVCAYSRPDREALQGLV